MSAGTKKVALITGANKGLGLETARQLGKQGITVLLGARDLAKGEAAAAELKKDGIDARAVKLDVNDPADYAAVAKAIEKDFGVLDILVNNAGLLLDSRKGNETSTTSADVLRKTFDTNFFAVVALTQALLPLRAEERGRADRESVEHPRLADAARDEGIVRLRREDLCLRRFEGCAERVHDSSRARACRERRSR